MISTNFEQSKHLFKDLHINPATADMSWYRPNEIYPYQLDTLNEGHGRMDGDDLIPSWSLNALFNLMPKEIEYNDDKYRLRFTYEEDVPLLYYVNKDGKLVRFGNRCVPDAWDILDAAYQMVCWLRENYYI